jgi:hypothetical protein
MGIVFQHAKDEKTRGILMVEMISRTIKGIIEEEHRRVLKGLQVTTQEPFRQCAVDVLAKVSQRDPGVFKFISSLLSEKYRLNIDFTEEKQEIFNVNAVIQVLLIFFLKI